MSSPCTAPSQVIDARRRFYTTLLHKRPSENYLQQHHLSSWMDYIDGRLKTSSRRSIVAWLHHIGTWKQPEVVPWYELLIEVIECIREHPKDSLVTIDAVAKTIAARHSCLWKSDVFFVGRDATLAAFGCLTMLFEPDSNEATNQLDISAPDTRAQPANDASQRAMCRLLDVWKAVPIAKFPDEILYGSFLNYFTLSVVAKTKVSLINQTSSHLSFSTRTKRLSVFAFPAFCAMCLNPSFNMDFQKRYDVLLA